MASAATHPAVRPFGKSALEPIGGGRFQHGDVVVDARGPWWTVRAPALSVENQPIDWLARPGLWKLEPALGGLCFCAVQSCRLLFALPWIRAVESFPRESSWTTPL